MPLTAILFVFRLNLQFQYWHTVQERNNITFDISLDRQRPFQVILSSDPTLPPEIGISSRNSCCHPLKFSSQPFLARNLRGCG